MAQPNSFPTYLSVEFDGNTRGLDTLTRFASQTVAKAGKDWATGFESNAKQIGDTLSKALTIPRKAGGSLDLSGTIADLQRAEKEAQAYAIAAKEMARAQAAVATSAGALSREQLREVAVLNQIARENRNAATSYGLQIAAHQQLQAELAKTKSATDRVVSSTSRGTTAFGANGESLRGQRQAFVQTGQQLQDLGISLYSGQRASTVFAQQLPQLAFALTSLEGSTNKTQNAIGKFASVLSGPLGSIALVAASIGLGILVENLFFAEKATDKLKDKSLSLREALDSVNIGTKEATKAIQDYNNAQEAARKSSALEKEELIKKAAARAQDTIKIRENIVARIEALQLADRELRKTGDRGAFGFGADADALGGNLTKAKKDVSDAQQALRNFRIERAEIGADLANDPIARINDQYDRMADAAKKAARGNDQLTASLEKTLSSLGKRRKADLDAENKKTRNVSESSTDGPSLSRSKGNEFLSTAKQFSGLSENNRSENLTLQAFFKGAGVQNIDPKITAWCAAFVNAVLATNGVKGNGALTAASFKTYGQAVDKPQLGDIVVLKPRQGQKETGHVGFYAGKGKNGGVLVTGGNQGNAVSTDEFATNRVAAYRRAPNEGQQTAIDTARAKALEKFAEDLQKIDQLTQRISGEFDDQPKLVDRIALQSLKLRQTIEDIDRDLADTNTTSEQRVQLEERKLALAQAQLSVGTFIDRQIQKSADDFNDQMQVQKLILAGREEEARVLERIQQKDKEFGLTASVEAQKELLKIQTETLTMDDASAEQKEQARQIIAATTPLYEKNLALQGQIANEAGRQVAQEIAINEAIERRNRTVQAYASYIDGTYSSLEKLLSGGKASDFFKEFKSGFKQLQGTLLTDKIFGGAFDELRRFNNRRSPENIAISNYVEQVDKGSSAILSHADALVNATARINGAANDNTAIGSAASNVALAAARASGGGITVDGNKSAPIRLANESVTDFVTRLSSAIVIPFTTELDKVFGTKFFGGLSGVLTGALAGSARAGKVGAVLGGAQGFAELFAKRDSKTGIAGNKIFGKISDTLGKALGGAETGSQIAGILKAVGIGSSRTGGAIGGAAGSLFGPIGEFLGGTIGSIVGGLFKKTKKGELTVTNSSVGVTGTKSLRSGLQSGGEGIQDKLAAIAEQLGGKVGTYSASISQKGKKFYVGGQKFDDIESAGEEVLRQAIINGAVTGLRAGAQKLIQAGTDLDRQLSKAIKFQSIFDRLKEYENPAGAALDRLNREFASLRSIAVEAGEGLVELEKLYGLERAKVITEQTERLTGALKSLLEDLKTGDNGLDLRTRLANARQTYDPLAATIRAGGTVDADKFAEIARTMLDLSRQINGSQSGYFSAFDDVLSLSQTAIDRQNAALLAAGGESSPFTTPTPSNDNVVGAIGGMSDTLATILNTQTAILTAINGNIGNLSILSDRPNLPGENLRFAVSY